MKAIGVGVALIILTGEWISDILARNGAVLLFILCAVTCWCLALSKGASKQPTEENSENLNVDAQ